VSRLMRSSWRASMTETVPGSLRIKPAQIPASIFGSYWSLCADDVANALELRTLHGTTEGLQKVPIHGWALRRLIELGAVQEGELREVYDRLSACTRWWFRDRDDDRDGVCPYNHGNECQDNATPFDLGCPVVSPDLSAYLALQCSVLGDVAGMLSLRDEAAAWRHLSSLTVTKMVDTFWNNDHFEMYHLPSGTRVEEHALVQFMPFVPGEQLPRVVFTPLLDRMMGDNGFLTPHGLATESTRSPLYCSTPAYWKGSIYWRGPVWAPLILLITDGLRRAGAPEEAAEIARRFVSTVAESGGFYENYDAVTGEGRDDLGYTWTASVFLAQIRDFDLGRRSDDGRSSYVPSKRNM